MPPRRQALRSAPSALPPRALRARPCPARLQPPTIGTSIASTSSAGYEASGRDFRYISSTIRVPDTDFLTGLYPPEYIQLSNGSLTQPTGGGNAYTRAGIESCVVARSFGDTCATGTWVAFVETFNNSLNGPFFSHFYNLAGVNQGDGVNFSIYYNEARQRAELRDHPAVHVGHAAVLQDPGLRGHLRSRGRAG